MAYSLIRSLCSGVLLGHNPERARIFIVSEHFAYFDAGGHPVDKPYVVVAGFVSSEKVWIDFARLWPPLLRKHGLGKIFHMTDFESDPNRSRAEKNRILWDLVSKIREHTSGHVICGVDMAAYKRVNEIYALDQCIGAPYSLCARGASRNLNLWKADNCRQRDKLLIFVEEGTLHHGDMEEAFRRDSLPVPQKIPKEQPPAQAADILAWEAGRYLKTKIVRPFLKHIIGGITKYDGMFFEKDLLKSCNQAGIPRRVDIPANFKIVFNNSPKRLRKRIIQ